MASNSATGADRHSGASAAAAVALLSMVGAASQVRPETGASVGTDGGEGSAEDVLARARAVMRRILDNRGDPNPCHLHYLAAIVEQEENRYEQQVGHLSSNVSRSAHTIGRLVTLIRDDDDFFELISTRYLVEGVFSTRLRAATARLLYSCVSCWMYHPHVEFEEAVLNQIKDWVVEDIPTDGLSSSSSRNVQSKNSPNDDDREILRTYSTGLLAVALTGGDVIEDVLTTGMVSKLMHYLRLHILGDVGGEVSTVENRSTGGVGGSRGRDEAPRRVRAPWDVSPLAEGRLPERAGMGMDKPVDDLFAVEMSTEPLHDLKGKRLDLEVSSIENGSSMEVGVLGSSGVNLRTYDASEDPEDWIGEDRRRRRDRREAKSRNTDWYGPTRIHRDEEVDDAARAEASRRRNELWERGTFRSRGRGRSIEALAVETASSPFQHNLSQSPGGRSGSQSYRISQDTSSLTDSVMEVEKDLVNRDSDADLGDTYSDIDGNTRSLVLGSLDLSTVVREASSAAEKEARAAKGPAEAVKAAGDAAAELVRLAATEALGASNDEKAAVAAAKAAALSVVEAARTTTTMSRHQSNTRETLLEIPVSQKPSEHSCDLDTQVGDCKMDPEVLTLQRHRFCIQCLEKMGEYLEVLGPVLHERGVDVCLALLQRKVEDSSFAKDMATLSDVLRLICALAAHRKFAALFVDRGGVQQLLATPRVPQTLTGLSLCLFALASLQVVMERVCALPPPIIEEVVALALQLLGSNQDSARRNAALFFGAAFVFRAIMDAFDNQDGLRKLLNILGNAALLRSGGGSNAQGPGAISGGARGDRGSAAEVLTSSGKQIAYHTSVALRQYFRAHLLLVVDSLRPCKGHRSGSRGTANARAVYKPLDLSNEAIESLVTQLQRDRKLGPAFVRCRWIALEKFMNYGGHTTLLELTQAAPGERYLNEIAQHALGVLQLVTLMPYTRKLVVGATLYNERSGMAVILEAASGAAFVEPEVIQAALLVLVNLVCPPPSLCSRPVPPLSTPVGPGQNGCLVAQLGAGQGSGPSGVIGEGKDRSGKDVSSDRNGDRVTGTPGGGNLIASTCAAVVGDRRISLGPGAGGSGLAAYMEQGYRCAREAVRSNNGIRVLLHLLYSRTVFPPVALDRIRALACRVLLGLARDDAIAHILTKLQVGKILSELLRDGGAGGHNASSSVGGEQGRWQAELSRVALDLIAIVTNAGRASTVAASEAAAPTLRRIERAAIAAATPISYHSRELLQLMHEHLLGCGLLESANTLVKEAQLTPLPSSACTVALPYRGVVAENTTDEFHWPSGRVSGGFLGTPFKQLLAKEEEERAHSTLAESIARKKIPGFSAGLVGSSKGATVVPGTAKKLQPAKESKLVNVRAFDGLEVVHTPGGGRVNGTDSETSFKTPSRGLSIKRKAGDKESLAMSPSKRMAVAESSFLSGSPSPFYTPGHSRLKSSFPLNSGYSIPMNPGPTDGHQRALMCGSSEKVEAVYWPVEMSSGMEQQSMQMSQSQCLSTPNPTQGPHFLTNSGLLPETRACSYERATLDSLVVQYLKHQHRQCPAPITTLPPLSLLHPHVCPEPSRALDAPLNTACRLACREICPPYGGVHGRRRDRHFVYSRFRPWRTCRDDANALLTTATFLGRAAYLAAGSHVGDIRIFDSNSGNILEIHSCHTSPITLLQSAPRDLTSGVEVLTSHPAQLLLSSTAYDVRLWDSSAIGNGALHTFDGCKAARFNHTGSQFGAIGIDTSQKEVLLYDVGSGKLEQRLSDSAVGLPRLHSHAFVHFSPSDILILWNGVLWDHRIPRAIHKFDQFTDYGGGGFHPAGNEVIINSEVWDLRSYKLLRSVPSLDQTVVNFNATADVIYAHLRRTSDDIMGALNPRRARHELFSAFRTMDAVDYSDIATTPVDRCVLDLATEATDSVIAVVGLEANEEMEAVVRLYEVGRRRPTDDDSDPDDGGESEDDDESEVEDDEDEDVHDIGDDSGSNDDEDGTGDDEEDDADVDFGGSSEDDVSDDGLAGGILELVSDGEDGHSRGVFSSGDESGDEFDGFDRMLQGIL